MAMYAAKQRGSGCLVYEHEHDRHRPERLALVSDLREAIDAGQLMLQYQPQVAMDSGAVVGVEALVRWRHPRRGLVPPDDFIPLAEQAGLIGRVTSWVLDTALEECSRWQAQGRELALSVNVSVRDLHDPAFPSMVERLLAKHQVPAELLTIEITENSLMADVKRAGALLCTLRRRGVRLSVDDFGTGYSSLAYLKGLPLDELKLDRSFIRELVDTSTDRAIVRATIALGHDLGLKVVAEGVEDTATIELLRSLGCDLVQGYAISRPLSRPDLLPWLLSQSDACQARAA
jgi:EAL domain-containing protein (putative c-di-GMP-specific phosphodiesterase class I)